ncbi:MAG: hypothetical protein ACOCX4_10630, partial [Planctomycetota bacterium]
MGCQTEACTSVTAGADAPAIAFDNGVRIETRSDGEHFLGLGEVRAGETLLRSGRRPMFAEIRNPWGVRLFDYRLVGQAPSGTGVRLSFAMRALAEGPMDWQLHECRPYVVVGDWSEGMRDAEDTTLTLELQPVERTIAGRRFVGFSYRYDYASSSIPVYLIRERGTWEIGGHAVGNEWWMRNGNCPPIARMESVDDHYSTEWYLETCTNPNIFQFLPLQTHLQGFTMTAADAGVLLTWCPELRHIRTLLEKQRGADELVHAHEHCGDLADTFATGPMEVLFHAGTLDHVDRANVYGGMVDLVYDTLHAAGGLRREFVPVYGGIEEWTDADLDLYRREGLPALADAGVELIELANHFQNNMNTWGVGNMCCTVDYKVAESVGEDRLKAFCDDAAARNVRVGMWGNTSISTLTWKFAQKNGEPKRIDHLPEAGSIMEALQAADRPFVINSHGAIEADHYAPNFCCLNLRDPVVRAYWMEAWTRLLEEVGVSEIFLDSSFNLSSDKFDWRFNADPEGKGGATADQTHLLGGQRPAVTPRSSIESQYHAHLSLIAEMQRVGYVYCGEDSGVFGVHRNGPGIATRLGNLHLWNDFIAEFDGKAVREAGADPDDVFVRGLA